jgi:hypothetical protein
MFQKMDDKVESIPKDIEELSSIKDYMATVPNELEKLKPDIKSCMGVYEILNFFNYQFKSAEDFDRKWNLFKAP